MARQTTSPSPLIEWGVATRTSPGQTVSGDLYLVKPFMNGVLAAVIDGLGHGVEATAASRMAIATLARHANESVIPLVNHCHRALLKTRGAVMTLGAFHALENTLTWLGVGNVQGLLLRCDRDSNHGEERPLLRGGVVGYQLPALTASVVPVGTGDLLIMASDGIRDDFDDGVLRKASTTRIAEHILKAHYKGNDDALVLVVRYLGTRHE